jgi:hypothetical protein
MERFIFILSCLSIFYAGAVWALEGCRDIGAGHELFHQAEGAVSDHHDNDAASHHSHSDPSKIHCPNVFAEFLVNSRVSLTSDHSYVYQVVFASESVHEFLSDMIFGGFGDGPPGPLHSKLLPRHLLLSVIRI